jgi:hypothetical protein
MTVSISGFFLVLIDQPSYNWMLCNVDIDGAVATLTSADGDEWSASRFIHFTSKKRHSCILLIGGWLGPELI